MTENNKYYTADSYGEAKDLACSSAVLSEEIIAIFAFENHQIKKIMFSVTILGSCSAMAVAGEISSAQIIRNGKHHYLVDCADGTTLKLMENKIQYGHIDAIFISHIHGDHTAGLINLLGTFKLTGRKAPLKIYAPADLFRIYETVFKEIVGTFHFKVDFISIDMDEYKLIHEDTAIRVYSIPLHHSVPDVGFLFKEKQKLPNVRIEEIRKYNIPVTEISKIKNGMDWTLEDGTVIDHNDLLCPPETPKSYAYCSDTAYFPELADYVKDVDLLYHEASFLERDRELAVKYGHSTAREAALTALNANVGQLIIGHISARYDGFSEAVDEAMVIFPKTNFAYPSTIYEL